MISFGRRLLVSDVPPQWSAAQTQMADRLWQQQKQQQQPNSQRV
jgi:hypothetical protein